MVKKLLRYFAACVCALAGAAVLLPLLYGERCAMGMWAAFPLLFLAYAAAFGMPGQLKAPWRRLWKTLAVLCAVWFGFLNPWGPGDDLPVAEKMMGLARHAHSVILYEMTGILWMLLLPAALTACYSTSGELIRRAFPRMPLWLSLPPAVLLPAAALLIWPDRLFSILQLLLPWRYLVSLICGAGLMICSRRRA